MMDNHGTASRFRYGGKEATGVRHHSDLSLVTVLPLAGRAARASKGGLCVHSWQDEWLDVRTAWPLLHGYPTTRPALCLSPCEPKKGDRLSDYSILLCGVLFVRIRSRCWSVSCL